MSRMVLVLALLGALGALQLARAQCLGFQCPPRTLGATNSAGGSSPPPAGNCLLISGTTTNCLLISGTTTNALLVK